MQPKRTNALCILFILVMIPGMMAAETIISKQDADHIFSLTKPEWEAYAQKIVYPPNWKVALSPHDTGTGVMAFDTTTGYGLSIQPLYRDDHSPPDMLIVGSYYRAGTLSPFSDKLKKEIEEAAKKDLGPSYSVTATYVQLPPFEGVELTVMKLQQ